MATLVQNVVSNGPGYVQSQTISPIGAVSTGNLLVLCIGNSNGAANSTGSVTDNFGNTWTKVTSQLTGNGFSSADLWYTKTTSGGNITVTVNSAGGGYYSYALNLREYSGIAGGVDAYTFTKDADYSQNHSTTVTTTAANSLIVYMYSPNTSNTGMGFSTPLQNGITATGQYTMVGAAEYTRPTAGATTGTITTTDYVSGVLIGVAFLETAVTIPTPPGPNNTANWYPYGALPTGKTVAGLRTIAQNWWTNNVKKYIVSTGMPSGLTGALRVYRPENQNDTVSEGMGYVMIGAVYMDGYDPQARTLFDQMYKYVKWYINSNGVMAWHIDQNGGIIDAGGATDGDYDIAWALHLASQRWGNTGTYNYAAERDAMLAGILNYETYSATHSNVALRNVMINGDTWDTGMTGSPDQYAPDYTAPMYYTVWSQFNSRWTAIKNANYPIYAATDTHNTGLIPDWQTRSGGPVSGQSYINGYNAVRRFRQVIDYLNYGSTQPSPYYDYYQHKRLADWATTQSGANPANLRAEWNLEGTSGAVYGNSTFNSSYMVAMLLNTANSQMAADTIDYIVAHPDGSYFGDTVAFMGLLTAAGYFRPTIAALATRTHTTSTFKTLRTTKSHTADTYKYQAAAGTFSTDYINFTFSNPATTYTRTHTTGTFARRQLTRSHTTDFVKRKAFTRTHTTSTVLRKAFTRSHSTDTLKRVLRVLPHTTDTLKRLLGARTHSTDVLKRVQGTRTHTTDILKRSIFVKSHSTSVNKRAVLNRTHNTDVLKRVITVRIHLTDVNKRKAGILVAHTTDTLKRAAFNRSHLTDILKRVSSVRVHTTDTLKRKVFNRSHTTDTLKRSIGYKSHTTSVNKRLANILRIHFTDTLKRSTSVRFHTTDTVKRSRISKSHTTDTLLRVNRLLTHTTDINKAKRGTVSHSTDVNRRKAYIRTHQTDVIKRKMVVIAHSTSVNKRQANILRSHLTDVLKRAAFAKVHSTDTLKRGQYKLTHTTDTYLRAIVAKTHSTDVLKRKQFVLTHSTNVNKRAVLSRFHTADVLKRAVFFKAHNTNTLLRKAYQRIHVTDTFLRSRVSKTHTTDVFRYRRLAVSHSTDVLKRAIGYKTHTTDVLKRGVFYVAHSTDLLKRATSTVQHSTDTLKRAIKTVTHRTDVLKRVISTRQHSTDTFKRSRVTINHRTDILKRSSNVKVHTTDTVLRAIKVVTHRTSIVKRIEARVYHSTDVRTRRPQVLRHRTDILLRSNRGRKMLLINGQWKACPVYVKINGTWQQKRVRFYDGTDWVLTYFNQ